MTASGNVLVLLSDEHNPWAGGFAGHACVRTPNLDALARRGTVFERAWTPSPLCVPARASLATGRYVHQHRCWDNALAYDGSQRSWMQEVSQAGLVADSIGKLHFRSEQDPAGFRQQILPMHIPGGIGQVWGSVRNPLPDESMPSGMFKSLGAGESQYNRYDRAVAGEARAWLREHAGDARPWALFVGLVAPHFPLVVPQAYLRRVLDDPALDACLPERDAAHHPWIARALAYIDHGAALGGAERVKLAVAAYLALVEFMDDQMGTVLDTLEQTGLAERTTVIYASDHGDNLGARGLWNKGTLYREAAGIPLLLAGPGVPVGQRCRTHASLVDIYPTVLDAMALPEPDAGLPGRSLRRLASEPEDATRVVLGEYHGVGSPSAGYYLVQGRYKYHHYVGYPPELFDLDADPHERIDLAARPEMAATLRALRDALYARLDPDAVDALAKRDQDALVSKAGGPQAALQTGHRGATPVPSSAIGDPRS
ncbi:Choline-sulfatase [Pigmentiphaga humi]|uniref:Choline-sulfatase n=1 Tax=Pigmentiphaga humi TaxID=2478468 RepID=A0A3P4B5S0_9BURK|nr:sulfatase-like hydrolase/transferase [Pigmentiphaga humi]VCU71008.1 Choline-sulfatase [Pigmentiphaga humi]